MERSAPIADGLSSAPSAARAATPGASHAAHDGWIALVERRLDTLVPQDPLAPAPLPAAMRDALLAPGKRLRPLLAMTATLELGEDPGAALDAGCALEMVHAASLALDDLPCMDDARLRRGRPALHVAYGQDVAILASIALLSRAFSVLAAQGRLEPALRVSLVSLVADCIGVEGLAGGQLEDLRGAAARRDVSDAQRCNLRKTGAPFAAAVDIAASIARAPARQRERLRAFALHLGCAFQIRDDILDATATARAIGKDTGRDTGKRTVVGLLGTERAVREMRAHLSAARRAASPPRERCASAAGPLARFLQAAFGPELRAMSAA